MLRLSFQQFPRLFEGSSQLARKQTDMHASSSPYEPPHLPVIPIALSPPSPHKQTFSGEGQQLQSDPDSGYLIPQNVGIVLSEAVNEEGYTPIMTRVLSGPASLPFVDISAHELQMSEETCDGNCDRDVSLLHLYLVLRLRPAQSETEQGFLTPRAAVVPLELGEETPALYASSPPSSISFATASFTDSQVSQEGQDENHPLDVCVSYTVLLSIKLPCSLKQSKNSSHLVLLLSLSNLEKKHLHYMHQAHHQAYRLLLPASLTHEYRRKARMRIIHMTCVFLMWRYYQLNCLAV
jgi:hypothetical protein